jgi:HAD superfamily hydrolase (TIGR01509 family)
MAAGTQIRAIVFDMDGVLIDSHPAHRAAWQQFLRSISIQVSDQSLEYILEGRTRTEILRHFLGELPPAQLEAYGKRKDDILRQLEHYIRPAPGVLDFLRELDRRGLTRAVATSASEIRTASTLERLGMGGYFDAVVTAADVSAGKPHPQVYQLACACLSVQPQQALAFDDAPAGVQAARSAGMRCIGVTSNGGSNALLEAGAEQVIPSFTGLAIDSILHSNSRSARLFR